MTTAYDIMLFTLENGTRPVADWIDGLNKPVQARILERIKRVRNGNFGDHKKLHHNISELRLAFGPGYRVYYSVVGQTVVLLLVGGIKRTQKKDIKRAVGYLKIYKE